MNYKLLLIGWTKNHETQSFLYEVSGKFNVICKKIMRLGEYDFKELENDTDLCSYIGNLNGLEIHINVAPYRVRIAAKTKDIAEELIEKICK